MDTTKNVQTVAAIFNAATNCNDEMNDTHAYVIPNTTMSNFDWESAVHAPYTKCNFTMTMGGLL